MTTIAIPIWQGRVSPVFDTARHLLIVEVEEGNPVSRREEPLTGSHPQHRVERLTGLGVSVLICGAVSRPLADIMTASGIHVIPFTAGGVDEVLTAYLEGSVINPEFRMPGCCGRRCKGGRSGRPGGHGGHGRGGRGRAGRFRAGGFQ